MARHELLMGFMFVCFVSFLVEAASGPGCGQACFTSADCPATCNSCSAGYCVLTTRYACNTSGDISTGTQLFAPALFRPMHNDSIGSVNCLVVCLKSLAQNSRLIPPLQSATIAMYDSGSLCAVLYFCNGLEVAPFAVISSSPTVIHAALPAYDYQDWLLMFAPATLLGQMQPKLQAMSTTTPGQATTWSFMLYY